MTQSKLYMVPRDALGKQLVSKMETRSSMMSREYAPDGWNTWRIWHRLYWRSPTATCYPGSALDVIPCFQYVTDAVNSLKNNRAPDPNLIPLEILKFHDYQMWCHLHSFITKHGPLASSLNNGKMRILCSSAKGKVKERHSPKAVAFLSCL